MKFRLGLFLVLLIHAGATIDVPPGLKAWFNAAYYLSPKVDSLP